MKTKHQVDVHMAWLEHKLRKVMAEQARFLTKNPEASSEQRLRYQLPVSLAWGHVKALAFVLDMQISQSDYEPTNAKR